MTLERRIQKLEKDDTSIRLSDCLRQLTDAELDALEAVILQGGEARTIEQREAVQCWSELWGS